MAVIGYVYCQVAQQFMDRFLGLGSVFAKVAEKGHRFKACVARVCECVIFVLTSAAEQHVGTRRSGETDVQCRAYAAEDGAGGAAEDAGQAIVVSCLCLCVGVCGCLCVCVCIIVAFAKPRLAQRWAVDHPGVPFPGTSSYETYDFEKDERWLAYRRNVEIPEGTDKDAAMEKVRHKWCVKSCACVFCVSCLCVCAAVCPFAESARSHRPPRAPLLFLPVAWRRI